MNEAAWRAFDREMGKLESGVGKRPRRGKQNRATTTSFAYEAPGELVLEDEPLQPNIRASSPARFAPEDAAPEPRGIGERFFQRGWEEQFLPEGQDEPSLLERAGLSGAPRLRPLINPSAASMVAGLEPSGPDITPNNPLYQGREIPLDRQSLARLRGETAADEANVADRGTLAMEVVNRPAGIVTETADFVGDVLTPWREQSRLDMEDRARYFSRVLPGIGRNITLSDESSPAGQARREDAEREDLARTNRATAEYLRQRVGPGFAGDGTAMIDPVEVTVPQNYNRLDQQAGRFIDDVFGYQGSRNTADSARRYAIGDALAAETTSTPAEAADAEVMAQSAAGEHFMRTAPWAIEFAPGIGVLPDLASAGRGGARSVGRAGWRATFGPDEELPYAFTPRASPVDPPGPTTQRYRSDFRDPALAATATYAGIEALDGEGLTAEPLEGAIGAGLAAGLLRARGGRSTAPAALRARPSAESRPIDVETAPTDLPAEAVARPQGGGIGDDVLENLPPAGAERDYSGAWEGSGYDAMRGRIDELEQAPPAPTPAPRAKPSFRAAIRDPETGRVYTGEDHWDAIASAPDDVRPRLEQIYDRPVEDVDNVGFEINGTFMRREEGLQALRDARGRSRPVGIGEQVNRDGTVTPAQPIDWDAPVAPERSALRDLGLGAGVGAIGGGLVGASLMDEAQAEDGGEGAEGDPLIPILAAGGIGAALMTMRGRGGQRGAARGIGESLEAGGRALDDIAPSPSSSAEQARTRPPNMPQDDILETARSWVDSFGGGPQAEARAVSVLRQQLSETRDYRRIRDLETMIAAVENRDYVRGRPNVFSARVEEAWPEIYGQLPTARGAQAPNTPFRDTFDGSVGMSGGAPRARAEAPPSNQRLNGEPQQSENLARTEADFLAALPRDPAQWREATALHPWINSPSRAQAVIMASARNADGSFVFSTSDILMATGISSENSLSVTLNKAREAGVPVPTRKSGRDGATAPLGGNRLTRIVEIMESAERNGVELTARQIAERAGVSRDAVNVALSQVRTNSAQSARVPESLRRRVAALDAARAARRRRNTTNATLAGAGIGGALGLGVMEEASAEEGQPLTAEEAIELYGSGLSFNSPEQWQLVPPQGDAIPSMRGARVVGNDGNYVFIQTGDGRVFRAHVMRGYDLAANQPTGSIQIVGEMVPRPIETTRRMDQGIRPIDAPDSEESDEDYWAVARPILSTAAGIGIGARFRRPTSGAVAGGTSAALIDYAGGGQDGEPPLTGMFAGGVRMIRPQLAEDVAIEARARGPEFEARRARFAETLPGDAPTERVISLRGDDYLGSRGTVETDAAIEAPWRGEVGRGRVIVPGDEMLEQGFAAERQASAPSPRDEFLALSPGEQLAWMDQVEARGLAQAERQAEFMRARGYDFPELPPPPRSVPEEGFPIGFYDPATGRPLFGESAAPGRRPPPRKPRKPFDELSPAAQARRVGSAQDQIEAARDMGAGDFTSGAAAMRALRERAASDPIFAERLRQRFPAIAALILGGGAIGSEYLNAREDAPL